jgi:hypothetical protein
VLVDVLLLGAGDASAAELERLEMPGPVRRRDAQGDAAIVGAENGQLAASKRVQTPVPSLPSASWTTLS